MSTAFVSQAFKTEDYELDDFGKIVTSRIVMWRNVVNDAVVGEWQPFMKDARPKLTDHSLEGLKEWMDNTNLGWDSKRVHQDGWDWHVYRHGLRIQFWIPMELKGFDAMNQVRGIRSIPEKVVCIDDTGVSLTKGKTYLVKRYCDELYTIANDDGADVEFLPERFTT